MTRFLLLFILLLVTWMLIKRQLRQWLHGSDPGSLDGRQNGRNRAPVDERRSSSSRPDQERVGRLRACSRCGVHITTDRLRADPDGRPVCARCLAGK